MSSGSASRRVLRSTTQSLPLVAVLLRASRFREIADPLQRHLDIGRGQVLYRALRGAEGPPRGAGERVAVAKRVEHLSANSARRVGAKRRAAISAVSPCRLHESDEAPCDEVLAVRAAAPWIDRARRDRPRELKVSDDAVISDRQRRFAHALPRGADRSQALTRCQ